MLNRFSRVQLFATPQTVARQAPLSIGFPRIEYWSRLPWPPPGDLPDSGIEPMPLTAPALVGGSFTTSTTWEAPLNRLVFLFVVFQGKCVLDFRTVPLGRWH